MFRNRDLKNLIIPLFLEQLLTILVGLADTFVISFVSDVTTIRLIQENRYCICGKVT